MLDSSSGPDADFDTWKADLLEQYQALNVKVKVAKVASNFGVPVGKLACQELLATPRGHGERAPAPRGRPAPRDPVARRAVATLSPHAPLPPSAGALPSATQQPARRARARRSIATTHAFPPSPV